MRNTISLKRLAVLLLFIFWMIPVLGHAEPQPTHGRVRVCGIKDTSHFCSSVYRYMPRAIMPDVYHMTRDVYIKWEYARVGTGKRIWSLELVDDEGNPTSVNGQVDIYFPYLSVYSGETGEYWKWTRDYSGRYDWLYCSGAAFFGDDWAAFVGLMTPVSIEPENEFGFRRSYGRKNHKTYIDVGVYIGLKDSNSRKLTITYNADRISRSGTAIGQVRILVPSANVRADSSLNAERIGAARQYQTYELLGVQDGWYRIRYSDSRDGYVSASLAEVVQEQQ